MNAFERAAREAIANQQQEVVPVTDQTKPFTISTQEVPQNLQPLAHWVEVCKPETGLSIQCRSDLFENVKNDPNFWNATEVIKGLAQVTAGYGVRQYNIVAYTDPSNLKAISTQQAGSMKFIITIDRGYPSLVPGRV